MVAFYELFVNFNSMMRVVAMILLFGATLDCTPSCRSNLFVEFL